MVVRNKKQNPVTLRTPGSLPQARFFRLLLTREASLANIYIQSDNTEQLLPVMGRIFTALPYLPVLLYLSVLPCQPSVLSAEHSICFRSYFQSINGGISRTNYQSL